MGKKSFNLLVGYEITREEKCLQPAAGTSNGLDGVLGSDLVDGSTSVLIERITVHLHQLGKIELGLLQHLHLADADVLKGEDGLAALLDLLGNGLGHGDATQRSRDREVRNGYTHTVTAHTVSNTKHKYKLYDQTGPA